MKALILFYSMYGHIKTLAQAVAEGVGEVDGCEAVVKQVPETLPAEALEAMGAAHPVDGWGDVPVAERNELADYDAIVFGTPTRFGNMCGQMRQFLDGTGGLWFKGALVGKVGSAFCSSNTQHGGQESTILSTHITLLHHGMVIVGLPYAYQGLMNTEEICGCSPYGASTIGGADGSRTPNQVELDGARFQGKHVAEIAKKLAG